MSITGIPNSFTIPGVAVTLSFNSSFSASTSFNVLVLGKAASNAAYANNPELYAVSSLAQLATDFGKTSDVYKIISQYRSTDVTTSVYALNCITGNTKEITSKGTITEINSILSTTSQTTDMAGTNVSATGGTGAGASFDITSTSNDKKNAFSPASVKINSGGTGYEVGDILTIPNVGTITVTGLDSETVIVPETDLTVLNNALPHIGNMSMDLIIGQYNSALAIQALDNYFTGTWGYAQETYGHYLTTYGYTTLTQAIKDSANFNKATCSIITVPSGLDKDSVLGAAAAGIVDRTEQNASLPLTLITLDVGTVSLANRLDKATRNTLFNNGFCTIVCDTAGNPTLENTRIGQTTDAEGEAVTDYTLETRFQAVVVAKQFRTGLSPYIDSPRVIMKDTDTLPNVSYVVTPNTIRSACIGVYNELISDLICTDLASYKKNLVVSQDTDVPGRVDISMIAYLAQGLKQIAINITNQK